ncbi:MAG: DegT/DnrJ/EryC1/StrS family aminotransferase [Gammaproteobacteria bacterium]|jgi:dTDP-4-amino-4,6-dideoxygalactose transaminase|nr:DegT/DnrJ/EryC1/StrS family aminotransferase [Gammaproteobacteria bacterium]
MNEIPITKVFFDEAEFTEIQKPLQSGWVVQGPYVKQFEDMFAEYTQCQYAKAVSNCTTALHLGLLALGIGIGDKVVVPSFTYVASANAVEYTGAEVVFCDIDLKTFNLDVHQLERLLATDKSIKAIMPVNLFGLCAALAQIKLLALNYNVRIIEDSACGFDAWLHGQHSGTFGEIGCFSFHPRKPITTGEGGMLITNDKNIYETVKQLCDHGASKSDLQRHQEKGGSLLPDFTKRGYNYRMTDFQGALGVCQIRKADIIMSKRRNIAHQYNEALKNILCLQLPIQPEGFIHGYQSYVCLFTLDPENLTLDKIDAANVKRNHLMAILEENGVATRQGTHAVHTLSYYAQRYNLKHEDLICAYAADRLSISLPLYPQMTHGEFEYVIDKLHEAIQCVV